MDYATHLLMPFAAMVVRLNGLFALHTYALVTQSANQLRTSKEGVRWHVSAQLFLIYLQIIDELANFCVRSAGAKSFFGNPKKPCVTEPNDSSHYQVCGRSFTCHQISLWGWSDSHNTKVIDLTLTYFLFASRGVIVKSMRLNSVNTKLVGGQHRPTTKNTPTWYEVSSWSFSCHNHLILPRKNMLISKKGQKCSSWG